MAGTAACAYGLVVVTAKGCRAETTGGRTVSLFALAGTATVTLAGTRWELHRRRLRPGSHGLSNRTGRELRLEVHRGASEAVIGLDDGGLARPLEGSETMGTYIRTIAASDSTGIGDVETRPRVDHPRRRSR